MTDLFTELPHDDGAGIRAALTVRRVVVAGFAIVGVLALANAFGQRASGSTAATGAATLRLEAPERVRGGLFFQSRIEVRARRHIEDPRFVLGRGWTEGLQVNSIEPAPADETSRDGRVVLAYGTLEPGARLTVWLQFEVDPVTVGSRPYDLELDDGTAPVARIHRDLRVLP